MTTDIEGRIQAVRKQVEEARTEAARREAQADQARAVHDAALAELSVLGHDSPESALAEVAQLQVQVSTLVEEMERLVAEGCTK